jgi:hypothetical protein
MISVIKISIANEPADIDVFGAGQARKITTTCDDDSASHTVAFYRFDKAGYKPLYISYQSSWGASGSGSTDCEVAYRLEDMLDIFPTPCTVLK